MRPTPTVPAPEMLDRLVTLLDASAREAGWYQPHRLVAIELAGGAEVAVRTLELDPGAHPLDHLLGLRAPASWWAIGAVCVGWAAPPDVGRPSRHPQRRRARVVTLVDRAGIERSTAALDDGAVIDEPGSGTVADALRRCLGLATAPPPGPPSSLIEVLWLSAIASSERQIGWKEAVALRSGVTARSWSQLREQGWPGLGPDITQWMDDGMFARWALGSQPSRRQLLDEVARTQSPEMVRQIRAALTEAVGPAGPTLRP